MTTQTGSTPADLVRMVNGYQVSQALAVAAELGIADLIGDMEVSVGELAAAAEAHEDALYRLLRALASVGVLHEHPGRHFSMTQLGQGLRRDAPGSIAGWVRHMGAPYYWNAWSNLLHSVRTGENAFKALYGTDVWSYRSERPRENDLFNAAMASLTGSQTIALLSSYDFSRFGTIADVGGGNGALLAHILQRCPHSKGILFDQEHVVSGAPAELSRAGVDDRCAVVAGSFFETVPPGADAYIMKSILHDYTDDRAAEILRVCRKATSSGVMLLVIERVVGPPNEDPQTKFSDLNMLVAPDGRERTEAEWRELFAAGGFRLERAIPTPSGFRVIEGVPV
ncbi:MAG: methyltransferase [Chloroflexi bacterium]|nr:methyltransferase [Chloroflexota bacterium]